MYMHLVFFLMVCRSPSSTLFPYTALFRSFQYIQEYTGFIYPGVVVVFGMGLLWKRATNRAALWTTIATIPAGIIMKIALPDLDRKSTRLNSSHVKISYAVFCLKKKKQIPP